MDIKIILKSGRCITRKMNQVLELNNEHIKIVDYDGEVEQISTNKISAIVGTNN